MTNRLTTSEHIQLWDAFRAGSRDAFEQLYNLFASDLYRYGYNLVRNKPLVEDCLHELFVRLYENRQRLGSTDSIQFYLYRALRRRLLDTVVHMNRLDSSTYAFDEAQFLIQSYEDHLIDEQLLDHQKKILVCALNTLPKRQREILYLVYRKGLTYQQAAEVMDITLKSVYNTVNIALKTLRVSVRQSARQQQRSRHLKRSVLDYFPQN